MTRGEQESSRIRTKGTDLMSTTNVATAGLGRRQFLAAFAAGSGVAVLNRLAAGGEPPARRSKMGLASDCWNVHQGRSAEGPEKGDLSDRSFS
jgi:hypothetical protein